MKTAMDAYLQSSKIVEEEVAEFRKGILPNSKVIWKGGGDVKTHALLVALEAKIDRRIRENINSLLRQAQNHDQEGAAKATSEETT